ncbi:MAG TPA: hypothetical protein VNH22_00835 [Blastocatellia bacterium]|jgi:hypothetical protein|nr:hypothetical protein [Blastocatellia bacterium]
MTTSASNKRLKYDHAEFNEEPDERCRVEVTFSFAERKIKATGTAASSDGGALKAAALATLTAVEEAVEKRFSCNLADIDHVNALGKDLIAVLVNVDFEGKQVQVFGSCQIAGSEIDAAVKAALNATNRFIELSTRP